MCALPLLLDPGIYSDFLAHDTGAASRWFTPTIAGVIKSLTGTTSTVWWFLPTVVGLVAGITFAVRTPEPATAELRDRRLLLLICFSLLTAPYAWTYDFLVLLPAGLFLVSKTLDGRQIGGRLIGGLPAGTLVLVAAGLVMFGSGDSLEFRVWYPAFFAAMLWLTHRVSRSHPIGTPIESRIRST
jgi:hypothetical protein